VRVLDRVAQPNPALDTNAPNPAISYAPFNVYNIGNHKPVELMTFIQTIEESLGQVAKKNFLPMQLGDVLATYADVAKLNDDTGFEPKTDLAKGISHWSSWYKSYTNKLNDCNR
jgi:UDP-glucuronate 4-epimerase